MIRVSGGSRLAAVTATVQFQMKVILVRPVVVGAKHCAETLAGTVVDDAQELAFCVAAVPSVLDRDAPPVGEDKA